MLSASSRASLIKSISEIAQRAHGAVNKVPSTTKQSVLPPATAEVVSDTATLLVQLPWPAEAVQRAAGSFCSSLPSLPVTSSTKAEWSRALPSAGTLLDVLQGAREGGHQPSVEEYGQLLKLSLCCSDVDSSEVPQELVRHMQEDHPSKAVEEVVYAAAIASARSSRGLQTVADSMQAFEHSSDHLIQAFLRTNTSPKAAMRVLMRRLVPGSVPLSPSSFDELLAACRRTSNLKRAWRVFRVMTQQYGMAPSQSSYQCLTELVAVNFSANTHGREQLWHVNLCRRLVEGTVLAYAGDPPLWVYVDMANTLVLLNGYRGYREMFNLSVAEVSKCHRSESQATALLQDVWTSAVYNSLLEVTKQTGEALLLLADMKKWSYELHSKTLIHLFQLVRTRSDLDGLFNCLLQEMYRSPPFPSAKLHLYNALVRVHNNSSRRDGSKSNVLGERGGAPRVLRTAASKLMQAWPHHPAASHRLCLAQLEQLGRRRKREGVRPPTARESLGEECAHKDILSEHSFVLPVAATCM